MKLQNILKIICLCMLCFAMFAMYAGCGNNIDAEKDMENVSTTDVYVANDIQITIPEEWKGIYTCMMDGEQIALYHKSSLEAWGGGWLCSFAKYTDETYLEYPHYEILEETDTATYIIMYPTDVQCDPEDEQAAAEYMMMAESLESVIDTFKIVE